MNLIRAALFAVFAFMGTLSLSAQGWLPPAAAMVVIQNELEQLHEPPVPVKSGGLNISLQQQNQEDEAKSGCTSCLLKSVKDVFLVRTRIEIRGGADTGTAVGNVHAELILGSSNNGALLAAISDAHDYMEDILQ